MIQDRGNYYSIYNFNSEPINLYEGNFFVCTANQTTYVALESATNNQGIRINYVSYQIQRFSISYRKVGNYTMSTTGIIDLLSPKLVSNSSNFVQVVPREITSIIVT